MANAALKNPLNADAVAAYLQATYGSPQKINLGLTPTKQALAALGNPHHDLPPVIHVAGTNGKGSTVAFWRALAEAHGLRAHVYTSPHLVAYRERIRLAGQLAADERIIAACEKINATGIQVSVFEALTIAAFLLFKETPADVVVLETGLGGRLDATNVIAKPGATVITPIDYDHTDVLGTTLSAIAGEKAGIFKTGRPAFVCAQPPEAALVFRQKAEAVNCPLFRQEENWRYTATSGSWEWCMDGDCLTLPLPALAGEHQLGNAALALASFKHCFAEIFNATATAQAMRHVTWPARLQRIQQGVLAQAVPPNWEVYLDGSHNPQGAKILASHYAQHWHPTPLHIIMGMLTSKDKAGFLAAISPIATSLTAVPIADQDKAFSPSSISAAAAAAGISHSTTAPSVLAAIQNLPKNTVTGRVLITGSLYLAGEVMAAYNLTA